MNRISYEALQSRLIALGRFSNTLPGQHKECSLKDIEDYIYREIFDSCSRQCISTYGEIIDVEYKYSSIVIRTFYRYGGIAIKFFKFNKEQYEILKSHFELIASHYSLKLSTQRFKFSQGGFTICVR